MGIVFISYSHDDSKTADEIVSILEELNIKFFRDCKDIDWGDHIKEEVHRGLEEASVLIVIISPSSVDSQWVAYETGYTTACGSRILPFLAHPGMRNKIPGFLVGKSYKKSVDDIRNYFINNPNWNNQVKHKSRNKNINAVIGPGSEDNDTRRTLQNLSSSQKEKLRKAMEEDGSQFSLLKVSPVNLVSPGMFDNDMKILKEKGIVKEIIPGSGLLSYRVKDAVYEITPEYYDSLLKYPEDIAENQKQVEKVGESNVSETCKDPVLDKLSKEAKELLLKASKDSGGSVWKLQYLSGFSIKTNEREFVEQNNPRSRATWIGAIDQLVDYGLLIEKGHKGEVFEITNEGYRIADIIALEIKG